MAIWSRGDDIIDGENNEDDEDMASEIGVIQG